MSKAKEEFQVVVVQSVICTAVVKVIAGSDEEAQKLARKEIGHLKPEDFRLEGGEQLQQPFAIEAVATSDLETGREDVRDLVMKDVRFTSMWADVSVGEGSLHAQPWLMEKSSTMRLDIIQDWTDQLAEMAEEASEDFEEMANVG